MKPTSFLLATALLFSAQQGAAASLYTPGPVPAPHSRNVALVGNLAAGMLVLGGLAALFASGENEEGVKQDLPDPLPPDTSPGPDYSGMSPADFETREYKRDWGLASMNASTRYADGGTGKGAIGALLDTGADLSHPEFADRVVYTHSYFDGASDVTDRIGHGTSVLGVMGANKDDLGMHGVAFDSRFLVFQGVGGKMSISPIDAWADATRKSAALGARSINHSWVLVDKNNQSITLSNYSSRRDVISGLGSDIFRALDYAKTHDLVSVYAAGNSSLPEVSITGGLPVFFPEYADTSLVVVAIDSRDRIAGFSNRCGRAADYCLAAPGVEIYAPTPGGRYNYVSGTSFATPHVEGAVLVLASNFPELTGSEITRILRDTARDLGAPGVDPIYGHGAVDLRNAIAPQGTLALQTSTTLNAESFPVGASHVSSVGGMTSALIASLGETPIMVTDAYDRGYFGPMKNFVGFGADAARDRDALATFVMGDREPIEARAAGMAISISPHGAQSATGVSPIENYMAPYASLIDTPSSIALETDFEGASVQLSRAASNKGASNDSRYVSAQLRAKIGNGTIAARAGRLDEDGAFVGTSVTGAFGRHVSASTDFISLQGSLDINPLQRISIAGTFGSTDFSGDGLLKSGKNITTSTIGISYARSGFLQDDDRVIVSASRDLSVTDGSMRLARPIRRGAAADGVRSEEVEIQNTRLDLTHTEAPLDLKIGYEVPLFKGQLAIGASFRGGSYGHSVGSLGYTVKF